MHPFPVRLIAACSIVLVAGAGVVHAQCTPEITQQPISSIVCNTQAAVASVDVAGDPADLSYQWQIEYPPRSGQWIDLADGILDLPELAYPFDIQGSRLRLTSSQPTIVENEKGLVISRCVITNACGSTISDPVTRTYVPLPVITVDPSDVSVCAGGDTELSVTASDDGKGGGGGGGGGGVVTLSYQWQFQDAGAWIDIAEGADIIFGAGTPDAFFFGHSQGSTTGVISLRTVSANDFHHNVVKRCVVTNACGSVISEPAVVSVGQAPVITTPPSSTSVCTGYDAALSCIFNDDGDQGETFCRWQIADKGTPDGWREIVDGDNAAPDGSFRASGSNSPNLVLRPSTLNTGATYTFRLTVTRACGSTTTDPVTLDVTQSLYRWEKVDNSESRPSHRVFPSLMSDGRAHVVLFGGVTQPGPEGVVLTDTWEFDGLIWSPRSNLKLSPQAGRAASMMYDPTHEVIVLFGGQFAGGEWSDETWTWDGQEWRRASVFNQPPVRSSAAMAPLDGEIVLFGGRGPAGELDDTWAWIGDRWVIRGGSGSGPVRRSHHSMTALGDRVVLFGGRSGQEVLGDTWTWDGTHWEHQNPLHSPPARFEHAMVYDPALGVVLLIGGVDSSLNPLDDLWVWDGVDWTQQYAPGMSARGPRQSVSMDGSFSHGTGPRNRVMIFGGRDQNGGLDDTLVLTRAMTAPVDVAACDGADATFTALPLSSGEFTYQWYIKRFGIGGQTPEAPLAAGPFLSDAGEVLFVAQNVTTPTLITSALNISEDRYLLGLKVYDVCRGVASDFAVLSGSTPPAITGQPHGVTVCPSQEAILDLELADPDGASYQWQVADPGVKGGWIDVVDGTNTLSNGVGFHADGARRRRVRNDNYSHTHVFSVQITGRCVATNTCDAVTSDPATIRVCIADFNCDGFVASQDFFDFLTAFFTLAPAADFNADGAINSQDFFDFLGAFFSGC